MNFTTDLWFLAYVVCRFATSLEDVDMSRPPDFEKLLLDSVDEGLTTIGESSKQAIYFHLEKGFDIQKQEIPRKIEDFALAVEKIFGIGAGFIPKLLNLNIVDRIIKVSFGDALKTQKRLAQLEGIFAGISSGAALWATLKVAIEFSKEDTLLCLLPDTGLNYVCEEFFGDLACC